MSTRYVQPPAQGPDWGRLLGSAAKRWSRVVVALVLVIVAAGTRFRPLAYIVLVFAAGTVFLRGSAGWAARATAFWAPAPPAVK